MQTRLLQLKRHWLILFLLTTLSLMVGCSSDDDQDETAELPAAPQDDSTPEVESTGLFNDGELEETLETIRNEYDLPALAAFVIGREGQLQTAAVGERSIGSGVAVTIDDLWHLGSITKSMTATLAAVLVDEGIIRWDSTVAEIFPEADSILEKYQAVELQQLLSMTGGIDDATDIPALEGLDLDDVTGSQRILGVPLGLGVDHGQPIGEYLYSNNSYLLASAMLEKITGQDWRALLQTKVMSRLDIVDFGFGPPGTVGQLDQPLGHELVGEEYQGVYADNPAILDPAGRVNMSLADVAKYASFHLKGKSGEDTLLSADVMQELYRGRTAEGAVDSEEPLDLYALGWVVDTENNVVFHDGSNTLWLAILVIDFDRNVAMFAVTNAPPNDSSGNALFDILSLVDQRADLAENQN